MIKSDYQAGDVLVLFGEVFPKGYVGGLIEAAQEKKMKIIYSTVGRRDKENNLNPLSSEEASAFPQPLINIPLEAGFDLEVSDQGLSPVDQLKEIKLSDWQNSRLDFQQILESQKRGKERFQNSVNAYIKELEKHIPPGKNVLFAHLMAGGVPRSKIILSLMNRALKGTGDRFLSSEVLWNSDIGKLVSQSFHQVTAETMRVLIESTKNLASKVSQQGGTVRYIGYGYHGTSVLIQNQYRWQTYTPYLQGWAKLELEKIADQYLKQNIPCCIYNCPEILTNSSSIFQGVELPLYSLISALKKENHPLFNSIQKLSIELLKSPEDFNEILQKVDHYLADLKCDPQNWPGHNEQTSAEKMLNLAEEFYQQHKDPKELITFKLSEIVIKACGQIMLRDSFNLSDSKKWINHEEIAKLH